MIDQQNSMQNRHPILFPSRFNEIRDEDWTEDVWNLAEAAVLVKFPEGRDRASLQSIIRNVRDASTFKPDFERRFHAIPVQSLSPADYFKHCIEKRMRSNVINVRSTTLTSQFVASTTTAAMYNNRRIFTDREESSLWTMEPLGATVVPEQSNKRVLLPSEVGFKKLYVVSGESGIGKTTYGTMTAELGICLTPIDFVDSLDLELLSVDDRNECVRSSVRRALTTILKGLFVDKYDGLRGKDPVTISLMMDEFGNYPAFVRGLCAVQDDVRKCLGEIIPFDVKIKMVVIGTGTDIKSDGIGSMPDTYVALRMPRATPMATVMKTAFMRRYGHRAATLVSALESHGQAQHLICNPRFAACLFRRMVHFCGPTKTLDDPALFVSEGDALSCLDMHLIVSARDYKLLGGMEALNKAAVARCYKVALELLLRDVHDTTKLTGEERAVLTSQGVLTDCSAWVPLSFLEDNLDFVAITGHEHDVKDEHGKVVAKVLAAPRTGRYEMSMAQQLLFRMAYGYHVLETAVSWQRYEVMIAEQVTMLLSGLEGRPLRDLLGRLGTARSAGAVVPTTKASPTTSNQNNEESVDVVEEADAIPTVIDTALDTELDFDTVTTVHSPKRIESTTFCEEFAALCQACVPNGAKRTAVVIVNGTGAQYADVIVVIPGVAVILVQCKFSSNESRLDMGAEAEKLRHEIDALNGFADVPSGACFHVLATTKKPDENVDLCGIYVLDTSSPTSLAPLFTPIPHRAVPAKKEYKIVRSMKATRLGKRARQE
ncbi:Hypothetical protein, putative [Bodo saltans]|uniref:Uncharacterized protein n=1 Tax=Bodo saltans TaxID=75058 RepID=A0A0S4IN96_BODSA|nr:Hypothetical protein, putative [Bodo saltans]|eukprot:CUF63702.1 Hypothetical protein, putative [Bodo saltans]